MCVRATKILFILIANFLTTSKDWLRVKDRVGFRLGSGLGGIVRMVRVRVISRFMHYTYESPHEDRSQRTCVVLHFADFKMCFKLK